MTVSSATAVFLAAGATSALVHSMEQSETSVKEMKIPMDWFNEMHATFADDLIEDTPSKTALDLVNLKETLESWGFSEDALLDLIMPKEDKVISIVEAAKSAWAGNDASGLTEEKKKEMFAQLEKARGLGLEQVKVFREIVALKKAIEKLGGSPGEELAVLQKEMLLHKQRFFQLQIEEAEVFGHQEREMNLYFPESVDPFFSIDLVNGKAALWRRSAAILRRF